MWTSACGGDLTGTWKYESQCGTKGADPATCPTTVVVEATLAGTITFDAAGWYGDKPKFSFKGTATFSPPCMKDHGWPDCTSVAKTYPNGSAECVVVAGGGCECRVTLAVSGEGSGQWVSTEGSLTRTDSLGSLVTEYCVQGDTLTLRDVSQGTTNITVASRQ